MASRTALLLLFNIMFFAATSACGPCQTPTSKKPHPKKTPPVAPYKATCSRDTLKFAVCENVLNLVNVVARITPKTPCCALIKDLVDLEAAVCLCTALKAKVLGINLDISVSLTALLNYCGKKVPSWFQCA